MEKELNLSEIKKTCYNFINNFNDNPNNIEYHSPLYQARLLTIINRLHNLTDTDFMTSECKKESWEYESQADEPIDFSESEEFQKGIKSI